MISPENTPDVPGWIDLGSPDQAASAEFYRAVFGWTAEAAGTEPPTNEYLLLRKDGKVVAGLGGLPDPSAKSGWIVYMRVADAEATSKTAETAGGTVRVPSMEVGTEGSLAQLSDPSGAEFALWQPGTTIGVERACEDDSLMWIELNTREPAVAKGFYGEVFGWKTKAFDDPDGSYDMWTLDPAQEFGEFGGVLKITEGFPIQDECWVPYFMVADCDATAEKAVAAGGQVVMPPTDAPPGKLASLTDPFGARFNLIKPAPLP